MWLQWRHLYADGPGEWDWYDFGDRDAGQEEIEDLCVDLGVEFSWSENYRGVEAKMVATPPIDHLRKVIREHEVSIRNLLSAKKRVESIIQELETPEHA